MAKKSKSARKKQKSGGGGSGSGGVIQKDLKEKKEEPKQKFPACKFCGRDNHHHDDCHRGGMWSSDVFWASNAGQKTEKRLIEQGLAWWLWTPKQPRTTPPADLQQRQQDQQQPDQDQPQQDAKPPKKFLPPRDPERKYLDRLIRNQVGAITDEIREEENVVTQDACYHVIRRVTEALEQEMATDDFWNT